MTFEIIFHFQDIIIKSMTKVVHKNISQGCNRSEGLKVKKKSQNRSKIKMTFEVIFYLLKNLRLHNMSIQRKFSKNRFINELAERV